MSEETNHTQIAERTELQKRFSIYRERPITKEELRSLSECIFGIVIGSIIAIGGIVLCGIVGIFSRELSLFLSILVIGIFMMAAEGIFDSAKKLKLFFAKTKPVRCPFCQHENQIFQEVTWLLCQGCRKVLLLTDKDKSVPMMIRISCPYCKKEYGISESKESIVCDDCNLDILIQNGIATEKITPQVRCEKCGRSVSRNVFYCIDCGNIINKDLIEFDFFSQIEKRVRKSPDGSYRYGLAILESIDHELKNKKLYDDSLEHSGMLLQRVEIILESFEEAIKNDLYDEKVAKMLLKLDYIYSLILTKMGKEIGSLKESTRRHEEGKIETYRCDVFFPWVDVRNKIITKLTKSENIQRAFKFTEWRKGILPYRISSNGVIEITDYKGLFEEAKRIDLDGYNEGMQFVP